MDGKTFMDKVENFLNDLPQPLIEPIWYPIPEEITKLAECLKKIENLLLNLAQIVINSLKEEGFFEENPIIRVYPNYPEATGIVIFYKGQKVFERWINSFELNWQNKEEVAKEVAGWYEQMSQGMSPEEYEHYLGQDGERWWPR